MQRFDEIALQLIIAWCSSRAAEVTILAMLRCHGQGLWLLLCCCRGVDKVGQLRGSIVERQAQISPQFLLHYCILQRLKMQDVW